MLELNDLKKSLSLYIHFPFCLKKCGYCDFLSYVADDATKERYIEQLLNEMVRYSFFCDMFSVRTIFLGGGTPSLMNYDQLHRILGAIDNYFFVESGAEISIECNPAADLDFEVLKSTGINRVSFGLQSMDDNELKILGRMHSVDDFYKSYDNARAAGFENINVDLMSAIPGQDMASWKRTLEETVKLGPEHIAAYSLIIEEHTPFYNIYGKDGTKKTGSKKYPPLPSEELEREMYHYTEEFLGKNGYGHYEISNYAKSGYECRHNLCYWFRGDYLGLGLGAHSFLAGRRFLNPRTMDEYMNTKTAALRGFTVLTKEEEMAETMFLGLRTTLGVGKREFQKRFGIGMDRVYGKVIKKYVDMGLMKDSPDRVLLTKAGVDVCNQIFVDFIIKNK